LTDSAEKAFVVFVLLLSVGGLEILNPLLRPGLNPFDPASDFVNRAITGDPVAWVVWSTVYGITFLIVAIRWRRFIHTVTRDKFLLLLLGIALISVVWSAAPEVTLRRSIALGGTTLFGVYLAMRYSLSEQLRLLAWTLGIATLLNLGFAVVLPDYGVSVTGAEGWKGFLPHKNQLGKFMTLGVFVFVLLATSPHRYRWLAWVGLVISFSLLLLSNSATALVVFLILLILLPLYRTLRLRYSIAVPCIIAVLSGGLVILVLLLSQANIVLDLLGKDATLSGRTELWAIVTGMIKDHFWLGYGYSGFWQGMEGESAFVWLATLEHVPDAHNGLLDLWLELGLLGVSVFLIGFLLTFLRAVSWARLTNTADGLWPVTFLTLMLLYNVTERSVLAQNNVFWILYVAITLSVVIVSF